MNQTINIPPLDFSAACARLKNVVHKTPLVYNRRLSERFQSNVFLKREDLQEVRSYKIRGAYNMLSSLRAETLQRGVVCASAGNHAQGFAQSCKLLNIQGVVFMPVITPKQKIRQTKMFGEGYIVVHLSGDTYDDCAEAARQYTLENNMTFIPPFEHPLIIEGQATVAVEIIAQFSELHYPEIEPNGNIDYVFVPVGGGGLCAGTGAYFREHSPGTKIIGVEPAGAASMTAALKHGGPVTLDHIERFVDGAAVKRIGDLTFSICQQVLSDMQVVDEGKICSTILELYNENAIVVEPAGAMSIAVLDANADMIKGKNIVCIVSGSNNDIDRMQEIKERSLQYEGLKHYFLISFAQRPGALKEFVNNVLGPEDDITRFEYMQKSNKENGPALVGIELQNQSGLNRVIANMKALKIGFEEIRKDDPLFSYLV